MTRRARALRQSVRVAALLTALAAISSCSSSAPQSVPINSGIASMSDADVLRQAVTAGLAGTAGVDRACIDKELAAIPPDFTIPVDTVPVDTVPVDTVPTDGSDSTDASSSDPAATDPAATDPAATDPAATAADPLDVLGSNDCGGDDTAMLRQLAASPAGRELVARVLVAGFRSQGRSADIVCVRAVVSEASTSTVDTLLTSADASSADITAKLDGCTK